MQFEEFVRVYNAERKGAWWMALCPAHGDRTPSLGLKWSEEKQKTVVKCFTGCEDTAVLEAKGLTVRDLFVRSNGNGQRWKGIFKEYRDANGTEVFRSYRTYSGNPKALPAHPCPGATEPKYRAEDGWTLGIGGDPKKCACQRIRKLPLWRARQVEEAIRGGEMVFVTEGESDAEILYDYGLVATTNPLGSDKWRRHHSEALKGADVTILPDYDEAGQRHAVKVAQSLRRYASSVRIVELPWYADESGKDVRDWVEAGHTKDELLELVRETAPRSTNVEKGQKVDAEDLIIQFLSSPGNGVNLVWREEGKVYCAEREVMLGYSEIRRAYNTAILNTLLEDSLELAKVDPDEPYRDKQKEAIAVWRDWIGPAFDKVKVRLPRRGKVEVSHTAEEGDAIPALWLQLLCRPLSVRRDKYSTPVTTSLVSEASDASEEEWVRVGTYEAAVRNKTHPEVVVFHQHIVSFGGGVLRTLGRKQLTAALKQLGIADSRVENAGFSRRRGYVTRRRWLEEHVDFSEEDANAS